MNVGMCALKSICDTLYSITSPGSTSHHPTRLEPVLSLDFSPMRHTHTSIDASREEEMVYTIALSSCMFLRGHVCGIRAGPRDVGEVV